MKFKFGVRGHDLVSKGSVEELASKLSKYLFTKSSGKGPINRLSWVEIILQL